ncbi:MAG: Flp family type IVb pilin [Propionicimonas sp.]
MKRDFERGATAAEYAIMASLIGVVIVVAVTALGQSTSSLFQPVVEFFIAHA